MTEKLLEDLTIKQLLALQVGLLMDIREGLIAEAAETDECPHPEENRVSLSTPSDLNHWVCNLCRHDNKAKTMN